VNSVRRPRVLMLLEGPYPTLRGGGAEAQVRTLTSAMRRRGQRVTVVAPLTADGPQAAISRVDGVPVCRLRFPRARMIGGPLLWLSLARFLHRRRHHYDVWHVHVARSWAVVSALLGRTMGKRVIVKVSGSWDLEHGALAPGAGHLSRIAYRCLCRVDAWQAISQRVCSVLVARGIPADRVAAIPNAVDTARFGRVQRDSGTPLRFVFIGRLVEEKDLTTLLDAFADVVSDPRPELLIVGTGALLESLQAQSQALELGGHVTFAGHRDDIEAILAQADIGILPSRFEGLSNALLECMAAGLPMIASRISGNEDFVRAGENGWLFEASDRQGLGRCIRAAMAMPPARRLEMGECARATVKRQASIERVLAMLDQLYAGRPFDGTAMLMSERRA